MAKPQPTTQPDRDKFNPNSTQNMLQFSEMRDDMMVMQDGSFRAVLECKSINFDLMSIAEREGVEYNYQNFINSLFFPVQILIRSSKVDIGPYLDKLLKIRSQQDNMLLNVLMDDYITYIEILSQEANIMEKTFYIVVPYFSVGGDLSNIKDQTKASIDRLSSNKTAPTVVRINQKVYDKAKEEIQNRVDLVANGLLQIGVQSKRLTTKELMSVFYEFYNPGTARNQPLSNADSVATLYSSRGSDQQPFNQEGGF